MAKISVYATCVTVMTEHQIVNVHLTDVDPAQVVAELGSEEVLDALDFEAVHNYVIQRLNEDAE